MEYIEGVNLADFLKSKGSPGIPASLEIAHQALLALGYLHRKGVVHRDVAPDNLMLIRPTRTGRPLVKLIDLGIAKELDRTARPDGIGCLPREAQLRLARAVRDARCPDRSWTAAATSTAWASSSTSS